jgi:DUF1680 family protein
MADKPSPVVVDTSKSPFAKLRPVPVNAVQLNDSFWAPRLAINREVTIPSQFSHLEETGRLDNFRKVSGKKEGRFEGIFFNDSDVYKWLEAASFAIVQKDDAGIRKMIETATKEIADAQQPDGYLNNYYSFERAGERWSNLKDMHELYCAGHFFQAAVAHYRATGEKSMLDVACRFADLICDVFGPEEEGKRLGACGHEEIEMAMVELYRATGEAKYLKQAEFFLSVRGRNPAVLGGGEYHQDHKPVREQDRMTGHAVRHVYLTSGMADVYLETGDESLLKALEALWRNMTERQMYITGGIGSRYEGESFGNDFELPNERAYTETCAAIGSVMWNWRMLAATGEERFAEVMELALYNGVIAGLSLDGQSYFYQNPLTDDGTHRRQPWFGCACCPPNVARLLAELPGYFYSTSDNAVWIHLYASNQAEIPMADGKTISLSQKTNYPWESEVQIEVATAGKFDIMLRIPRWAQSASVQVNGASLGLEVWPGSYCKVSMEWKKGDLIRLRVPVRAVRMKAHPNISENLGRVALMRGPLVYCVEEADNPGVDMRDIVLPSRSSLNSKPKPDLLGGIVTLVTAAQAVSPLRKWDKALYIPVFEGDGKPVGRRLEITAIPYYAWANREPGRMQVWLKEME